MEQSGPRHSRLKSPLIERPDLQSAQQRTLYGVLTLAFWALWFYLWLPVLALLAWALGVQQAYKYMVLLDGYQQLLRLLGIYCLVILLLGGGLVLWASYSIFRFRGIERRSAHREISSAALALHFGQPAELVARWQGFKQLYVTHDQAGHITRVAAQLNEASAANNVKGEGS
jgi:biofilm PGA synthesis protein PgaD